MATATSDDIGWCPQIIEYLYHKNNENVLYYTLGWGEVE